MPMFIEGWIEVTSARTPEEFGEYSWRGVVDLSGLIMDEADLIAELLFGLTKYCITQRVRTGLAVARGIPEYPSQQVQRDLDSIRAVETQLGPGEVGGLTWATWEEIAAVPISPDALSESRWRLAYAMAQSLIDHLYATPDQVRFVVWYSW